MPINLPHRGPTEQAGRRTTIITTNTAKTMTF